ncbi:MAG: hypothetical protein ACHQFW_00760, partial [Chitinophagales bacterium]
FQPIFCPGQNHGISLGLGLNTNVFNQVDGMAFGSDFHLGLVRHYQKIDLKTGLDYHYYNEIFSTNGPLGAPYEQPGYSYGKGRGMGIPLSVYFKLNNNVKFSTGPEGGIQFTVGGNFHPFIATSTGWNICLHQTENMDWRFGAFLHEYFDTEYDYYHDVLFLAEFQVGFEYSF